MPSRRKTTKFGKFALTSCVLIGASICTIGHAAASEIGPNTRCVVIHAAIDANDVIAYRQAMAAAQRWLLSHDTYHLIHDAGQVDWWSRQGLTVCYNLRWGEGGGTLGSAMQGSYNYWASQTRVMLKNYDNFRKRQDDLQRQQEAERRRHHEQVMKELGQ